ncbi:hypothetical protein BJ741DRAFT_672297 [Chytriomyces cf. hyalinus JEL632]|nr:hypothetical protein BJ741DRAFT_672297 [Chytriomyces cf. hyalinus JEL632]
MNDSEMKKFLFVLRSVLQLRSLAGIASLVARVRVDSAVEADTESLARLLATLVKCIGDSRHAAALEALKLLLRNKAVNHNGIALKGAARLLEWAWAGYG